MYRGEEDFRHSIGQGPGCGGTGEYLLMQAFAETGVDPQTVEHVYLIPSDIGPSFMQNHVDA